jgi:hypothetical protein
MRGEAEHIRPRAFAGQRRLTPGSVHANHRQVREIDGSRRLSGRTLATNRIIDAVRTLNDGFVFETCSQGERPVQMLVGSAQATYRCRVALLVENRSTSLPIASDPRWSTIDEAATAIMMLLARSTSLDDWLGRHVGPSSLTPQERYAPGR